MDYKQHKGNLRGQIKNQVERKLYNKRIRAEAIDVDTSERQLTIPVVTNRYYFDCWKRDGKLKNRVILATCEEDAIAIFKSKYPDMNFDRPFI